jgi:hypothetical protein
VGIAKKKTPLIQLKRTMKQTLDFITVALPVFIFTWFLSCCKAPLADPSTPGGTNPPTSDTGLVSTEQIKPNPIRSTDFVPDTSASAYSNIPLPPTNYRIKRIIFRSFGPLQPSIDPQKIVIDNKSLPICVEYMLDYQYDRRGRLIKERKQDFRGRIDSTIYEYSANQIIINSHLFDYVDLKGNILYDDRTDTARLDNRGLALNKFDSRLTYNADNVMISAISPGLSYSLSIVAGNVVSTISQKPQGGFGDQTDRYIYYLKRPNLPGLLSFYGSEGRNLPAGFVRSVINSTYYGTGDRYRMRYLYEFDRQGLVKRRIGYGVRLIISWPFEPETSGVTDYEYESF